MNGVSGMKLRSPRPRSARTASAGTPAARATSSTVKTSVREPWDIDGKGHEAKALPHLRREIWGNNAGSDDGRCPWEGSSCPLTLDPLGELVALALREQPHGLEAGRRQAADHPAGGLVRLVGRLPFEHARDARRRPRLDGHDASALTQHAPPLAHRREPRVRVERRHE